MQAAEGKTTVVCPNCQSEQETCPCAETSTPVMQAKKGRNKKALDARIRKMVMIAMFTAIAYMAMLFIHIKVGFLTMDVKDAVIKTINEHSKSNFDQVKVANECVKKIQQMYDTKCVVELVFTEPMLA